MKSFIKPLLYMALGFVICLLFWRPWNTITVKEIKPIEVIAKEVDHSQDILKDQLDSFKTATVKLEKDNSIMEKKLYAYWQENKRLKAIAVTEPVHPDTSGNDYYTKDDFIRDLKANAEASDLQCAETVNNLHAIIAVKDSAFTKVQEANTSLLKNFNEAVTSSYFKDENLKVLNKKLKWQKTQNIVFKGAAVAAAIFILKSAIK
jgi:hypothetical protein